MSGSRRIRWVALLCIGSQLATQDHLPGVISEATALCLNIVGCIMLAYFVWALVDYIDKKDGGR